MEKIFETKRSYPTGGHTKTDSHGLSFLGIGNDHDYPGEAKKLRSNSKNGLTSITIVV
jgi:hypothetical protein